MEQILCVFQGKNCPLLHFSKGGSWLKIIIWLSAASLNVCLMALQAGRQALHLDADVKLASSLCDFLVSRFLSVQPALQRARPHAERKGQRRQESYVLPRGQM